VEAVNSAAPGTKEEVYILQDTAGQPQVRFTGTHLAYVSTGEHRNSPRWLTLDLYRKLDGTYILHRIGYSVVYHAIGGSCEGGKEITLPELLKETQDGEPCAVCGPMPFNLIESLVRSEPATKERVSLERVYYKVIEASGVPELVRELEFVPRSSRTGRPVISRPGQELLYRAADHDEPISRSSNVVRDI
jgi:hypothetical protein